MKRLTVAQFRALDAMQQGRDFDSGPHLNALASRGLIERSGPLGSYEATQAGIAELLQERKLREADREAMALGNPCPDVIGRGRCSLANGHDGPHIIEESFL